MDDRVTRFYEDMYAEGRAGRPPGGLLGRMYVHLRRFELHRIPATFALLDRGDRLLDLGCGDGTLLALARASKFREVHGIDVASAVVRRAEKTCEQRLGGLAGVYITQQDLNQRLALPDNFVDAVTAIAVIEHIFDPFFTLGEIHRVLRSGGQFIMEVPNLVWLPRRCDVLIGRLPVTGDEEGWDGGHLHYFTFRAVKELLTVAGFRIEYMGSTGIFHRIRNVWPSLLGGNVLVKARKRDSGREN